jgi:hypothetical protein
MVTLARLALQNLRSWLRSALMKGECVGMELAGNQRGCGLLPGLVVNGGDENSVKLIAETAEKAGDPGKRLAKPRAS